MEVNYEEIFKNGNFGKVVLHDGKEDLFVIVDDIIIYKNCNSYDYINDYKNEYLTTYSGSKIMVVTKNVHSYENLEAVLKGTLNLFDSIIWKRNEETKEEKKSTRATLTISQIKEKLGVDELTIICE